MKLDSVDTLVLDTSVVVKWFRPTEILATKAIALRQAYLDGTLRIVAPDLLIYELANVLRYRSELSLDQVQRAVQSILDLELSVVPISPTTIRHTIALARTHNITVYDASFIAQAQTLSVNCITADARLARKLEVLPYVYFLNDVTFSPVEGEERIRIHVTKAGSNLPEEALQ